VLSRLPHSAPDYIGFGHSAAPSREAFRYTFESLAKYIAGLVDLLKLEPYIIYVQGYGGPVGFRLFLDQPTRVTGFIIQNASAYVEGMGCALSRFLDPLWADRTPETEAIARELIGTAGAQMQWLTGAKNREAISPDNWVADQALMDRPEAIDYQLDLLEDYKTNAAQYPLWQATFRSYRPRTLIGWGKHDPFFTPAGARAYLNDIPDAKLLWLDSGHFALEEHTPLMAAAITAEFAAKPVSHQAVMRR